MDLDNSNATWPTFLWENEVKNCITLDALERGMADILYMTDHALLIRAFDALCLHCENANYLQTLLEVVRSNLKDSDYLLYVHDAELVPALCKWGCFGEPKKYFNISIDSDKKISCSAVERLEIRPLDISNFEFVKDNYRTIDSEAYLEDRLRGHMFGAWLDGEPVGFIGEHEEGSMGMLEVLPKARRRGIATALECFMVEHIRKQGRRVFGSILADNAASLAMHRILGYEISSEAITWLFRSSKTP